jgi:hypothetical protein
MHPAVDGPRSRPRNLDLARPERGANVPAMLAVSRDRQGMTAATLALHG